MKVFLFFAALVATIFSIFVSPDALALTAVAAAAPADMLDEVAGEMKRICKEWKGSREVIEARLHALEQDVAEPKSPGGGPRETVGSRFAAKMRDAAAFKHLEERNQGTARVTLKGLSVKELVHEGANPSSDVGTIPVYTHTRQDPILEPQRPLSLLDVLPMRQTTADAEEYLQIITSGEAGEQEDEGTEKPEIDFDGLKETAYIATIAGHMTVSQQVLWNAYRMAKAIDNTMRYKVRSRFENQIVNGPGGQGKIHGLVDQGAPFTPTIGATPADIIGEALTTQLNAGYMPGVVVMNPFDWFQLTITKTEMENEYLFGSPTNPLPPALWNTRVVTTPSLSQGTALTIDTSFTTILDRFEPTVFVSTSHNDYFTRNLALILCEMRAGLEVLDPAAIYVADISVASSSSSSE